MVIEHNVHLEASIQELLAERDQHSTRDSLAAEIVNLQETRDALQAAIAAAHSDEDDARDGCLASSAQRRNIGGLVPQTCTHAVS